MRGGGSAGGGRPGKDTPHYVRHIPKFLQKYSHLMEQGSAQFSEGPQITEGDLDSQGLQGNIVNSPGSPEVTNFVEEIEGATIVEDSGEYIDEARAANLAMAAKEKGNSLYTNGKLDEAIEQFTEAIKRSSKDPVLYSNRSAAYAAKKDYWSAESDARKAIELRPRWPKAYSRLGAALYGLNKFEEAEEIYKKGLREDAQNPTLLQALNQVQNIIRKQEAEALQNGRHFFQKRKPANESRINNAKKSKSESKKKSNQLLSFGDDTEGS